MTQIYKETQYLSPPIKWVAVIISSLVILGATVFILLDIDQEIQEVKGVEEWIGIIVPFIVGIGMMILMFILRLDLRISGKELVFKLKPIQFKEKSIDITDILSIELVPIKWYQFGGYGRRRRVFQKTVAYVMNRKHALRIRLKNGKTFVFSTENERKLRRFLNQHFAELFIDSESQIKKA